MILNKKLIVIKSAVVKISCFLVYVSLTSACTNNKSNHNIESDGPATSKNASVLTEDEKAAGWELLFEGDNTRKWRSVNGDSFPSAGWTIKEGVLVLSGENGGDIITREKYSDFELVLDFKLTDSANSGIKYFVGEMKDKNKEGNMIFNGPEYQIIDDYQHPAVTDDQKGDLISTAALYLLYVPENKKLNPAGEWNTARIIAKDKAVEHWLNGVKVLSYHRGNDDFRQRISKTKFSNQENYGELKSGHILLTDHNDKVYFRNIRIRRLNQ